MENFERGRAAFGPPITTHFIGRSEETLLQVARWRHNGHTELEAGGEAARVVMSLSQGQVVEQRTRGRRSNRAMSLGSITLTDPEERTLFSINGYVDFLAFYVPIQLLHQTRGNGKARPVHPLFDDRDRYLEYCAMQALVAINRSDVTDSLLLESIAFALAERLSQLRGPEPLILHQGGLSRVARTRVCEWVELGLQKPVFSPPTLEDLSSVAGLSVNHFLRSFRKTFGETPHAYVLRRRLESARTLLVISDRSVGAVALRLGFASPAHFVAAFRVRMGVTPGAFRHAVEGERSPRKKGDFTIIG